MFHSLGVWFSLVVECALKDGLLSFIIVDKELEWRQQTHGNVLVSLWSGRDTANWNKCWHVVRMWCAAVSGAKGESSNHSAPRLPEVTRSFPEVNRMTSRLISRAILVWENLGKWQVWNMWRPLRTGGMAFSDYVYSRANVTNLERLHTKHESGIKTFRFRQPWIWKLLNPELKVETLYPKNPNSPV